MISAFRISGNSMEPGIRDGDIVVTRPLKRAPRVGDRVVYREPAHGLLVAHRVNDVSTRGAVMAGDANPRPDPLPVENGLILGRIVIVIPKLGRLCKLNVVRPAKAAGSCRAWTCRPDRGRRWF